MKVVVDGAVEAKSNQALDLLVGPSSILYKLRCIAITGYVGIDSYANADLDAINYGDLFRDEWVVMRSFKDLTIFNISEIPGKFHRIIRWYRCQNNWFGNCGADAWKSTKFGVETKSSQSILKQSSPSRCFGCYKKVYGKTQRNIE